MITLGNNHQSTEKAVTDAFGKTKFPCGIRFKNLMPRVVVMPVVSGMILRQAGHEQAEGVFAVESLERLQSVAADIVQIAILNNYEAAMEIETAEALNAQAVRKAAAAKSAEPSKEG